MMLIIENEVKLDSDESKKIAMLIENIESETLYSILRIILNKLKRGKISIESYSYVDVVRSKPLIIRFLNNNLLTLVYVYDDVIKIQVFTLCS
jgi:uncharacterized protein Veg